MKKTEYDKCILSLDLDFLFDVTAIACLNNRGETNRDNKASDSREKNVRVINLVIQKVVHCGACHNKTNDHWNLGHMPTPVNHSKGGKHESILRGEISQTEEYSTTRKERIYPECVDHSAIQ